MAVEHRAGAVELEDATLRRCGVVRAERRGALLCDEDMVGRADCDGCRSRRPVGARHLADGPQRERASRRRERVDAEVRIAGVDGVDDAGRVDRESRGLVVGEAPLVGPRGAGGLANAGADLEAVGRRRVARIAGVGDVPAERTHERAAGHRPAAQRHTELVDSPVRAVRDEQVARRRVDGGESDGTAQLAGCTACRSLQARGGAELHSGGPVEHAPAERPLKAAVRAVDVDPVVGLVVDVEVPRALVDRDALRIRQRPRRAGNRRRDRRLAVAGAHLERVTTVAHAPAPGSYERPRRVVLHDAMVRRLDDVAVTARHDRDAVRASPERDRGSHALAAGDRQPHHQQHCGGQHRHAAGAHAHTASNAACTSAEACSHGAPPPSHGTLRRPPRRGRYAQRSHLSSLLAVIAPDYRRA